MIPKTMPAAWYERTGPAREVLILGELPTPQPGPGEVLVRLATSAINPSDVKTRAGRTRPLAYPRQVPHSDGAGTIVALGRDVPESRLGQRVWIWNGAWQRPLGSAAAYIALPDAQAPALPPGLDDAGGACLGIPVMTAHRAVFVDGPPTGQTVLVAGGAGLVGHFAVQLAAWSGARVLATVSSAEKAAHARAGGAHETIDYRQEDVAARVATLTDGHGVDRIIEVEFGGNITLNPRLLAMGGSVATYGSEARSPALPFFDWVLRNATIRMVHMYGMPDAAKQTAIAGIAAWCATARPLFTIAARFPLERIADAHETVEAGSKIGHVLLDL